MGLKPDLLATVMLGSSLLVTLSAVAASKPNIVVIYTDDQGFGDASCLNPEAKFQTPNLDRLAHEGIRFTHGHSSERPGP
jgi:arylsulfatase A